MKFLFRIAEFLLVVVVAGGLAVVIVWVIGRTARAVVDWMRVEMKDQLEWLRSLFPKRRKKKK